MKRHHIIALVTLSVFASACEPNGWQPTDFGDRIIAPAMYLADTLANRRDHEGVYSALEPVVHGEAYLPLSPRTKYRVDTMYGWAAFQLEEDEEAHKAAIRATAYSGADMGAWSLRIQSSMAVNDFGDVYTVFKVLRTKSPDFWHSLSDVNVHAMEQGFGTLPNAAEAQLQFEQYLETSRWNPTDPFFTHNTIWYHFARNLLAAGDRKNAFEVASCACGSTG
jgi:hypothetical protein